MSMFEDEFYAARIALKEAKHIKKEFEMLFYNEESQKIIRGTAKGFFDLVYVVFRESLVVKLCKLSDPAVQGRNMNLTAEYLLARSEVKAASNYSEINDIYESRIVPLRQSMNWYRNKYAIHSDLETLQKTEVNEPSDKAIMDFYEAINDFYNAVSIGVFKVGIHPDIGYREGAAYLMHLLKNKISKYP